MAEVKLEKIEKRFGETRAVAGIDLTVRDQEFVILVGPSGCGKTRRGNPCLAIGSRSASC